MVLTQRKGEQLLVLPVKPVGEQGEALLRQLVGGEVHRDLEGLPRVAHVGLVNHFLPLHRNPIGDQ